ncbi:MAG: hypothetical protein M3P51_16505 [Chloroflexota bacterium]|nr:hypothetical protein [Chloroflexota bacterium]
MFMFPGGPFSFTMGVWAAVSSALANRLTPHRLRAALLTGLLMSLWPQTEIRLQQQPVYRHLLIGWIRVMGAVYSFQHRRHRQEYERELREMVESHGFDPETGRPPEPETLLGVIPIGQTVRLESESLMMLSIESYAEGFVVHSRLLLDQAPEAPNFFDPPIAHSLPELGTLEVRDDRGHRYPVIAGGGGGGDREWRFEFRSGRPLDPQSQELVLELQQIGWRKFRPSGGEAEVERLVVGPWTFRVSL